MRLAPAGWALVAITCGFTLVSVVVFLFTGAFSPGWLVASAIVYGLVAVGAIALAAVDRAPHPAPRAAHPPAGAPLGEPRLVARETIYATPAGEAVRLTYRWPDDTVRIRYVAMTTGEMVSDQEIATYVDALPPAQEPADLEEAADDAIARRATPRQQETETA